MTRTKILKAISSLDYVIGFLINQKKILLNDLEMISLENTVIIDGKPVDLSPKLKDADDGGKDVT